MLSMHICLGYVTIDVTNLYKTRCYIWVGLADTLGLSFMGNSFTDILREWHNFFSLTGEAAVTLMGLVFVAASLGASLVKTASTASGIRAFVNPTIIHFSAVLVLASLTLIPTQGFNSLGSLLCLTGVAGLLYAGVVIVQLRKHHR